MSLAQSDVAVRKEIDWSRWIAADQAAPLLGVHRDSLTRRCREELSPLGVAVLEQAAGDSQERWWLTRSVNGRLAAGEAGRRAAEPTLENQGYAADKANDARQRLACVKTLRRWRVGRDGLQKDWMPVLVDRLRADHPAIKVSRSRLLEWDRLYRVPGDLKLLVDQRGGADKTTSVRCWAYFERLYLDPARPGVAECWRKTGLFAKDSELTWCKLRTCQLQLDQRIPPAKQRYHRHRAEYNSKDLPTLAQDPERFEAGRCWVADHSTLDFFVRVRCASDKRGFRTFRPTLTTFQDWRTRRIVGWCLAETPSSDTILLALREGMLDPVNMGGPTEVLFDNGKDFDSQTFDNRTKSERRRERSGDFCVDEGAFKGVLGELGIEPHFSLAYSPNGKSRQERF